MEMNKVDWEARCTTKREMAKEKRYVRMNTVERGVGSPQPRPRHVQRREKGSGQRTSKIEQQGRKEEDHREGSWM